MASRSCSSVELQIARAIETAIRRMPGRAEEATPEDQHIMPCFGREHISSASCWCSPYREEIEALDAGLWIHRVMH